MKSAFLTPGLQIDLQRCLTAANEFERLVLERHKLLHGKPATTVTGDQRLVFPTGIWEISNIQKFAEATAENAIELNDILHNVLP